MNEFEQDLVRALIRDQHPDLAHLTLRDVAGGWDNQMWRLGTDLAVRLPRTERGPALLRTEQTWLPRLAGHLPLPTPVPVRVGEPSPRFEHTWTIVRWVEGEPADHAPLTRADAAETLAGFLLALHQNAPAAAPTSATRSAPLARFRDEPGELSDAARETWEKAVSAPAWHGAPTWLHGDLHPANVVVREGTLAGVLDFGDMCAGDPATDLSAAWLLLPDGAVNRFFAAYGAVDEATVTRARGWAVLRALSLISVGRLGLPGGKPTWEPAGRAALRRALDTYDGAPDTR